MERPRLLSRRQFVLLATMTAIENSCLGAKPHTISPEKETIQRINSGERRTTPHLTIENQTPRAVLFDIDGFCFTVKESFLELDLLAELGPDGPILKLQSDHEFADPKPPFNQIRIAENEEIEIATGLCLGQLKSGPSSRPDPEEASKMLSYFFIGGVFYWAENNNLCLPNDWQKISSNFFRTCSGPLAESAAFARFSTSGLLV